MRRIIVAIVLAALALPWSGEAAPIDVPPVTRLLVEGHTVFAEIEPEPGTRAMTSGPTETGGSFTHPPAVGPTPAGARWMNDQILVATTRPGMGLAVLVHEGPRSPCTGAVLVQPHGDPDLDDVSTFGLLRYETSYRIEDPNTGLTLVEDEWSVSFDDGATWRPFWAVGIHGPPSAGTPDDGTSRCISYIDVSPAEGAYPDGHGGGKRLRYNAVLWLPLDKLDVVGPAMPHDPALASQLVSACEEQLCPGGDVNAQGNSHPYRFLGDALPSPVDGTPGEAPWTHATRFVDVRYGVAPEPPARVFTTFG